MIFHCIQWCTYIRERLEASKFDSLARMHFLDLFPLIIYKKSDLAFISPAHEDILLFQSALFNQNCSCNLCSLVIKVRFDNKTLSLRVKIFLEVELSVGYLYYFLFK
jgi:hypothetical protein